MISFGRKIKKIFATISILSILGSFAFPFSYTYAQTQTSSVAMTLASAIGCSNIGESISSLLSDAFSGGTEDFTSLPVNTKDGKTAEAAKKEKCWDAIGYAAAKTALAALTQTTINYINSGFEGNPFYIRDENSFYRSLANQEVYSFVSELNDPEKYPFGPEIASSIATIYGCEDDLDKSSCFREAAVFTLVDDIGENWEDFADDFSVGGWQGWLSMTQNPYNNPIGFNFEASRELNKRIEEKQSSIKDEVRNNGGFLSVKKCVAYYQMGDANKDGKREPILDETGKPIIHTSDPLDTGGDGEILYYDESGAPIYDVGDISSSFDYEYSYLGEIDGCAKYETTTPGSVISDQINISLGSSVRQLELADEMNESLAAVFDALINKLVYDGLNSLQTASLQSSQSSSYGANDSYYINGEDAWYTDPFAPVDLYLALRCVDDGAIIPGAELGDHVAFWGGLYGGAGIEDPGIDIGGTGDIGYEDLGGGIEGEIADLEDGDDATGYYDPGIDDPTYEGPVTIFGVTGTSGPFGNLVNQNPPCKTDIARTEEYIEKMKESRDIVALELLPLLRKIDRTLPEPDVGWETRMYEEYLSQREAISQTLEEDLAKLNYISMIPLAGIVTGMIAPNKIESANQAISTLDNMYPREVEKVKYDITHHNIPSAPVARTEAQKIPTYEDLLDAYNQAIAQQQSNLSRLNYINSELPPYSERNNPENAVLMDRLQATYAYASPNLATDSAISTTQTEKDTIEIDIETAKNILPVIENEALLCNGWNGQGFGCHEPINTNELAKIGSKRSLLTSPGVTVAGDIAEEGYYNREENTLLGLIRFCWPDGVNVSTTAYAAYSSGFYGDAAMGNPSLCTTGYLIDKGLGTTEQEVKDYIYLVYQYKNKLLVPIDETANPYSVFYPFPNPPYNPWTMYQLVDPIAGDEPISVDGYLYPQGSNIYSNYLSLEARIFFHWVGEVSDDSTRRLQINPFIKAYDNSEEYGI